MADDTDDPKTTDPAAASGSDDTPPAAPAGEGGDTSGGSSTGNSGGSNSAPVSTALNPQIVQAVGTTNHAVLNGAFPGGNGIAYQKVAQAAAYAVQDSTDYMRNIMSMASAATGVALQKMLAEKTTTPYADIITAATKAVGDAQETFTKVGTAASSVVKDFDTLA
ncbi:MAG: hypothetical protein ABID63_08165 [Pseudomonadota bacterium]